MSFPFSPLSSPIPFQLGNYNSPQGITQGGFTSASPMVRRLAVPRSASKLPHVNPPVRRIGSPGNYQVVSPQNMNVLPSMSVLNRYLREELLMERPKNNGRILNPKLALAMPPRQKKFLRWWQQNRK